MHCGFCCPPEQPPTVRHKVYEVIKLRTILRSLQELDSVYMAIDSRNATTNKVGQLVSPCPICGQRELASHQYSLLASEVAETSSASLFEFFQLFKDRRWQELNRIQRFEGACNAALIYALFCPNGGCVVAVRDPVELWDTPCVLDIAICNSKELEIIRALPIELRDLVGSNS